MTAKELLEDERYGYDHFTKLTSTGINPDEDNIAEFAEYYHRRKLNLLGIHIVSGSFYNHKPTGIKGTLLKKYKPTGKPETIMIDTLDNDVYYAPAVEFEEINYH